jgi:iron-sulfur cluster insertion protein
VIDFSPGAVERVKTLLAADPNAAGKALRLYVEGGGCAGFQYGFKFDEANGDDTVSAQDGFEVVIDPMSSMYLMGVRVEYTENLSGAGFEFKNPNASGGCGCGKSFAV